MRTRSGGTGDGLLAGDRDLDKLLDTGFHDSWKTIDISEDIPGLTRHWSAEEALQQITTDRSS